MTIFKKGHFNLHSGQQSNFKIDCDGLSDEDIETIAAMLNEILPPFGAVEGIPEGGLRLAQAMRKYSRTSVERRGWYGARSLLIVDDVFTTGGSMERQRAGRDALGAVIFARNETPYWITPLWTLT